MAKSVQGRESKRSLITAAAGTRYGNRTAELSFGWDTKNMLDSRSEVRAGVMVAMQRININGWWNLVNRLAAAVG